MANHGLDLCPVDFVREATAILPSIMSIEEESSQLLFIEEIYR